MRLHHPCVTMMYRYTLFLCFLSRTVIGDPIVEIIGNSSSTSCGNFTSMDGNFQSVTFKVTGDWGNSALDVFNTPYLRHANDSSICALVNQQDKCAVQSNLHYTCTCENKTGGVYHLTFTSSPSYPLVSYAVYLTWANGLQKATSHYFVVEEVKNESCACEVHLRCIIVNPVFIFLAAAYTVVLLSCWRFKKLPKKDNKIAWIPIFLAGLLLCIAVFCGHIVCYAVVKDCLLAREKALIGLGTCTIGFTLMISSTLFFNFGPVNCKNRGKPCPESKCNSDKTKHGTIENIVDCLFKQKKRNKDQRKQHRWNTQVQDLNEECTPTTQSDLVKLKSNKQEGAGQGKLKKKEQLGRISDGNVNDNNGITDVNVYDNVDDNDGNVNDNNGNTDGNVYDNVDDNDGTNEDNSDTCNNNDSQLKAQKSSSGNKPRRLSPLKSSSPRPLPVPGGEKPDTYVSTSLSNQSGLPMNVQYSGLQGKISKKSRPPSIEVPSKQNI